MAGLPTAPAGSTGGLPNGGKRSFPVIPDGRILNVEVEICEVRPFDEAFRKKYEVEDTHEVSFRFRVQDGEFEKRVLFGSTSPYCEEGSKLYDWSKEIMGKDSLPEGYVWDSDQLTGLRCRIQVKEHTKQNGEKTNKVKALFRAEETQYQATPAAASDEAYEPFVVDAGEWDPAMGYGSYPERML